MSSPSAVRAFKNPAPVFAALGDATRLKLVSRLVDGQPRSIAQLADGLDLTRQGITKHLRVLQRAGIVKARSVGRESRFTYVPDPVDRTRSSNRKKGALSSEPKEAPTMSRLRVNSFSISLDGYGAGPNQSVQDPLGVGGMTLHHWAWGTRTLRQLFGNEGGSTGVDDEFAKRGFANVGAWILGRNMFGPVRGPWPDETWRGWWGDEPPYHCDVFVLTHHARKSLTMQGGTTFHFVKEGIDAALDRARKAAGGKDVRLGGGVDVIRQYLRSRLIDELHVALAPVLLGAGEALFQDIDLPALGYEVAEHVATPSATHVVLKKAR